jgi:GxxExxY protein
LHTDDTDVTDFHGFILEFYFFLKTTGYIRPLFLINNKNYLMIHQETTSKVICCFYKVYNNLGFGFLEKVYENALYLELINHGLNCSKQFPVPVFYEGIEVGLYYADIIVNNEIIIELKAAEALVEEHEFQLINYLKATNIEIGLLLNFGKEPQIKRKIFTNDRKANNYP